MMNYILNNVYNVNIKTEKYQTIVLFSFIKKNGIKNVIIRNL